VEADTRILESRRPIAVEDELTGDEISHSTTPLVTPGGTPSHTLKKPKTLATVWWVRCSLSPFLRFRQLLRWLTWR
jgi:hypothetical protein